MNKAPKRLVISFLLDDFYRAQLSCPFYCPRHIRILLIAIGHHRGWGSLNFPWTTKTWTVHSNMVLESCWRSCSMLRWCLKSSQLFSQLILTSSHLSILLNLFSTSFQPLFNLFSTSFQPLLNLFSTSCQPLLNLFPTSSQALPNATSSQPLLDLLWPLLDLFSTSSQPILNLFWPLLDLFSSPSNSNEFKSCFNSLVQRFHHINTEVPSIII